jgi:hypothetical protein
MATVARVTSERGDEHPARVGAIGAEITAFPFLEPIPLGCSSRSRMAFGVDRVRRRGRRLTLINGACCRWVERQWGAWIAANAKRMEATLAKRRTSRLMRHPVAWITRGSDAWFTRAAILMNPVIVIALARTIGGQSVGPRPVRSAAAGYSLVIAAVFQRSGSTPGDAIRAAYSRTRYRVLNRLQRRRRGPQARHVRWPNPRQIPAPSHATAVRSARNQSATAEPGR